jgi:5-deoxy-glucuronate isomerase
VKTGSVIAIDKGYHPSVAAPGYEMYYFTVIVGESSKSLKQYFDPHHEYQVHTIPGIKDMIAKFK